jgi:predicted NodU family carbamoyl transferase
MTLYRSTNIMSLTRHLLFSRHLINKAAVLCLDGIGEWATSSVGWAMETH